MNEINLQKETGTMKDEEGHIIVSLNEDDYDFYKEDNQRSTGIGIDGAMHADSFFHGSTSEGDATINRVTYNKGKTKGSIIDTKKGKIIQFSSDEQGNLLVTSTGANDFGDEIDPVDEETPDRVDTDNTKQNRLGHGRNLQDDGSILDVMVVWTKKSECRESNLPKGCILTSTTEDNIRALIDLAVLETNTAYTASGVDTQLRLVHAYRHDSYDEDTGSFSNALSRISSTTDGIMDDVHGQRTLYGADLVALIIDHSQYCGIAYLGPSITRMFSVTARACATGYFSFGHEIGHNLVSYKIKFVFIIQQILLMTLTSAKIYWTFS